MNADKTNIYIAMMKLAKMLHGITAHLPRDIKYTYGTDIRSCATNCLKCLILANRNREADGRLGKLEQCDDSLALLEANLNICEGEYVMILNKVSGKRNACRPISTLSESNIGETLVSVRKQLEGWMKATARAVGQARLT